MGILSVGLNNINLEANLDEDDPEIIFNVRLNTIDLNNEKHL